MPSLDARLVKLEEISPNALELRGALAAMRRRLAGQLAPEDTATIKRVVTNHSLVERQLKALTDEEVREALVVVDSYCKAFVEMEGCNEQR